MRSKELPSGDVWPDRSGPEDRSRAFAEIVGFRSGSNQLIKAAAQGHSTGWFFTIHRVPFGSRVQALRSSFQHGESTCRLT